MRAATLALTTACFGLGFGLNAAKSNQLVYLLSSVRLLHPELWSRDFLVQTRDYHPLYAALGASMLWLDPSGWLIGLANVAAACVGAWCVYRLLRLLLDEVAAFAAFLLVLTLAAVSGTNAVGGSYVFGDIFQPSTLGSVGLLGACLAFVAGRWLLAGLCLAFAGAFHLNYLLLGLCVFGVAWLGSGSEQRFRRGALLLGPSLPVLVWFLPLLLASSAKASPGLAEEARRIYQDVRSPHHYQAAHFARELVPWLGFQLLGAAALLPGAAKGQAHERRWLGLLAGFTALIAPAVLLSSVVLVRAVVQLFAWRVSPHANLLAQAALAIFVVRAVLEPKLVASELGRPQRVLLGLGSGCLLLAAALGSGREAALLSVGFVLLALAALRCQSAPRLAALAGERRQGFLNALLCITFVAASVGRMRHLNRDSDLLGGRDRDVSALCGWLQQSTPKDALLLIPPDEEEVRYRCQRAVVVDWKATPALPSEVMEWERRIEDVTGRRPLRGEADLSGFQSLDLTRLQQLRARYGFDTLVLRRGASLSLGVAPDFASGRFVAYRLAR